MKNFNLIGKISLIIVFFCAFFAYEAKAQSLSLGQNPASSAADKFNPIEIPGAIKTNTPATCQPACKDGEACVPENLVEKEIRYSCKKVSSAGSSSGTTGNTSLSACDAGVGLFGGLLATGKRIFVGMRDLIYVVAGFGIIGVAVGGFFGNLNWKWLGAIVIGLVVIASTGELINTIVGCDNFTSSMITDTLTDGNKKN